MPGDTTRAGQRSVTIFPAPASPREADGWRSWARHSAAPDFTAHVVRDGRLVTRQNPASAAGVAEEVLAVLGAVSA